jgi:hypothetical protein
VRGFFVDGLLVDGLFAGGFLAGGFLAGGFLAGGFLADGFLADGFFAAAFPGLVGEDMSFAGAFTTRLLLGARAALREDGRPTGIGSGRAWRG